MQSYTDERGRMTRFLGAALYVTCSALPYHESIATLTIHSKPSSFFDTVTTAKKNTG
jgi:hypothetical protein